MILVAPLVGCSGMLDPLEGLAIVLNERRSGLRTMPSTAFAAVVLDPAPDFLGENENSLNSVIEERARARFR